MSATNPAERRYESVEWGVEWDADESSPADCRVEYEASTSEMAARRTVAVNPGCRLVRREVTTEYADWTRA